MNPNYVPWITVLIFIIVLLDLLIDAGVINVS